MKFGVILAAGRSSRFKSDVPKCFHKIGNKSIISGLIDSLNEAKVDKIYIVVNRDNDVFFKKENFDVCYVYQEVLNGSGGALYSLDKFINQEDELIVVNADTFIYDKLLLNDFYNACFCEGKEKGLVVIKEDIKGYGRVKIEGNYVRVIEENDLDEKVDYLNMGIYYFKGNYLKNNLYKMNFIDNKITCLLEGDSFIYYSDSLIRGVNTKEDFMEANRLYYLTVCRKHLLNGVKIYDCNNTYIDEDVVIGDDVEIYPNNYIFRGARIGKNSVIFPNCFIENSVVGNDCKIGPFSSIRDNNVIDDKVIIGSYVEVKNSLIKKGVKAKHHAYLGNAVIGENSNVGCGTITANYDGKKKNVTEIGDNCFIGSNVTMVAPLTIGKNVFLAAGSTVVHDVKDDILVIAREREVYKTNPLMDVEK